MLVAFYIGLNFFKKIIINTKAIILFLPVQLIIKKSLITILVINYLSVLTIQILMPRILKIMG